MVIFELVIAALISMSYILLQMDIFITIKDSVSKGPLAA